MGDREPADGVRGLESLQWAYRAAVRRGVVAASLIVVLGLAGVFALVGRPEQQGDMFHRALLWITCAVVCWPACHALAAVILYLLRFRRPAVIASGAAGGTLFFTLFCTAVAYTAYGLFYPARTGSIPILAMYVNVTLLTVVASAILHFVACQIASTRGPLPRQGTPPEGTAAEPVVPTTAPAVDRASWFFERVPADLGRDLVCLRVSGHYLEVVTADGSCLVLLTLSDAVKALGDLGMQVHRSHWVAHRHVLGMLRQGQRTLLRVTGEREVPVSRSRVAEVRRAMRGYEA